MARRLGGSLTGLRTLQRNLKRLEQKAAQEYRDLVNRTTVDVWGDARDNVAVDTGPLGQSIRHLFLDHGLTGFVGTGAAQHAAYVEFGTGPAAGHGPYRAMPPAEALADWARRHGMAGAEWAIAKKIFENGTKPQPFLFPAFERHRPRFLSESKAILKRLRP